MPDAIDALFSDMPPTIGPSQAAERLGVSTKTFYNWLREGHVRGYQIGSTWLILTEELKDTMRAGRQTPSHSARAE